MKRALSVGLCSVVVLLGSVRQAAADNVAPVASPENNSPRLGGHLGVAIPMVIVESKTTTIGGDFVTLGIAPGITARLSEKWAIDYEFVAYSTVDRRGQKTALVIDPGVVYDFGPFVAGLRAAIRVTDQTNFGLIPIINKGIKIGNVAWFAELDLPIFFNERVTDATTGAATTRTALIAQLQTGIGF